MLAQLNLFSSLTEQETSPEKKPEIQTRKLTPPTIIKIEETETVLGHPTGVQPAVQYVPAKIMPLR